ncbi:hypothetical protein [Cellulomonas fengjieae]|uniref:Secreted protein n=1 Tax=Cellulomonas fengjieae TaxID=2819978 RepID=A0ABS3SC94_9CELL|nr:hypothetical protein [Cellulomonas fengjieae]MBO3083358.1 hypothetical protein [Cellulomonas fengjieae]QVI65299.1 hypothetical protein KG102_14425 [Cellulomonas fengjieae]
MTQTITPPTASPTPATPAHRTGLRGLLSRTPGKMRAAGVVAVLAAAAVGVIGLNAGLAQSQALSDADADTTQLVGIQDVRNDLVVADATATNAFLVGGLEPPQQRERYDEAVASAANGLARLAGSNAADAELLGQATAGLTTYTGLVEQARANNRQGFPVGAAYLDQASSVLRTDVLPQLDALVQANTDRVDGSFNSVGSVPWLLALCVVALALLVVVQVWLAKRTHRRLNAGLFWATVLALAATLGGAVVLGSAAQKAGDARNGPYDATVAVSQAYSLANDAKSQESFTLIKRGSGAAYEEEFVLKTDEARELLARDTVDPGLTPLLEDWVTSHQEIRALDDGGDWDSAVALAVSEEPGAPNDVFETFSTAASSSLEASAAETHDALSGSGGSSVLVGWLMLVAGVLAAALAWRGISTRVEEYR